MPTSSEPDLHRFAFGYSAAAHASKLPAWRLRLQGASVALRAAADRGDRTEVIRLLGDVWFWIGRLAGELMAAATDPAHADEAAAAAKAITAAYPAVYQAAAVLDPQRTAGTGEGEVWWGRRAPQRRTPQRRAPRQTWHDQLPGGLADDRQPWQFDPAQLRAGMRVELEHTSDRNVAREIAMDHLVEHKGYYPALAVMERALTQRARARRARARRRR